MTKKSIVKRDYIIKAFQKLEKAKPYDLEIFEKQSSDIFNNRTKLDSERVSATMAKITLEKFKKCCPEEFANLQKEYKENKDK